MFNIKFVQLLKNNFYEVTFFHNAIMFGEKIEFFDF